MQCSWPVPVLVLVPMVMLQLAMMVGVQRLHLEHLLDLEEGVGMTLEQVGVLKTLLGVVKRLEMGVGGMPPEMGVMILEMGVEVTVLEMGVGGMPLEMGVGGMPLEMGVGGMLLEMGVEVMILGRAGEGVMTQGTVGVGKILVVAVEGKLRVMAEVKRLVKGVGVGASLVEGVMGKDHRSACSWPCTTRKMWHAVYYAYRFIQAHIAPVKHEHAYKHSALPVGSIRYTVGQAQSKCRCVYLR